MSEPTWTTHAAKVEAAKWEAPTLEGRTMADLGQQLAAMRAERDRWRAALRAVADARSMTCELRETVARLRETARAATPGPWHYNEYYPVVSTGDPDWAIVCDVSPGSVATAREEANGRYIAAANPTTILALCEALDAALAAGEGQ